MRRFLVPFVLLLTLSPVLFAQENNEEGSTRADSAPQGLEVQDGKATIGGIEFEIGPCVGRFGNYAEVEVPEGLLFTGRAGTVEFLTQNQNITGDSEVGMVAEQEWFVIFSYDESGHVKDDEKDELDADDLLATLKENNEYGNEVRKQRGWAPMELVGWHKPPFYDPKTNNLTWATIVRSEQSESINWSTKLLGRTSTMNVDLVVSPQMIDAAMPKFEELMAGYAYTDGHKYAEFRPGDKVAQYGLTALVAGGAGVVAFKTGLLATIWKFMGKIWYLVLAGLAAAFSAIKRLFGGKKEVSESTGS